MTLSDVDKERYLARYNDRLAKYGYDPRTLGWGGGLERQYLRFRELMRIAEYSGRRLESVLDVGCGFGDLCRYCCEHALNIQYTGIDINDELLRVARNRQGKHGVFFQGDIFSLEFSGSFDVVLESGIFNAELQNQDQLQYIESTLRKMYLLCTIGIAADFMTTKVDWVAEGAFHLDPGIAMQMALRISSRVVLRHDYLPYEYCIYILKD